MSKKVFLFFILIFSFSFNLARASLEITETMYDPLGSDANVEYIKVKNSGTLPIDLSTWYVADYDTSWHFHKIKEENVKLLDAGVDALVINTSQVNFADFKTKTPDYHGLLFRASFTLGNDAGRLGLSADKKNIVSDTSYIASVKLPPAEIVVEKKVVPVTKTIIAKTTTPPNPPLNKGRAKGGVSSNVIPASPIFADNPIEEKNNLYLYVAGLFSIIFFASGVIYFIRKKKVVAVAGNDFEILDE